MLRSARVPVVLGLFLLLVGGASCKRTKGVVGQESRTDGGAGRQAELLPMIDSHVHIIPLTDPVNLTTRIFARVGVVKFAVKSAGIPGEPPPSSVQEGTSDHKPTKMTRQKGVSSLPSQLAAQRFTKSFTTASLQTGTKKAVA